MIRFKRPRLENGELQSKVCPVIECDVCKKSIDNPRMALVIWQDNDDYFKEYPTGFMIVHKGKCDRELDYPFSAELDVVLGDLLYNIGIKSFKQVGELMKKSKEMIL